MRHYKVIYIACVCLESTGELVCEITFDRFTSKELKFLADFCGNKYYVCSMNSRTIED